MSSTYAGSAATYPAAITIPDDGDAASMAVMGATLEGITDRTSQMTHPKLIACAAGPYEEVSGTFTRDALLFSLIADAAGGEFRAPLVGLVNGAEIASVDVIFTADGSHTGLPAADVTIEVKRSKYVAGEAISYESLGTASYTPVSLADYNDGKPKALSLVPSAYATVDTGAYVYTVEVANEASTDARGGTNFLAFRVNYV